MTLDHDSVQTGNPLLDRQHQTYFRAVEDLVDLSRSTDSLEPEMIGGILASVQEYAVDNFDTEEYLMQLEVYPAMSEHKEKHDHFKEQLDDFIGELDRDADLASLLKRLKALLVTWFDNQIRDDDMRLARFLKEREKQRGRG